MCAVGTIETGLSRRAFLTGALAAAGAGVLPPGDAPAPTVTREEREDELRELWEQISPAAREELLHSLRAAVRWSDFVRTGELPAEEAPVARQELESVLDRWGAQLGPRPRRKGARREYDCTFLRAGRVPGDDGTPSAWMIPAEVLRESVGRFEARPVYLDQGDRGVWQADDLVGVTSDPWWDPEMQAVRGGIRLYDAYADSTGARLGPALDQLLADQEAGLEVSPFGLWALFWHTWRYDEGEGAMRTTSISHVGNIGLVCCPEDLELEEAPARPGA